MKNIFLSVIIPVFNEEHRVHYLEEVALYLKKQKYTTELIVVNDGSLDKTKTRLQQLSAKLGFKMISYSPNRGKGAAIKTGMLVATGKYRLFMDVDLSTPVSEIGKLIPLLPKHDVVIGTRKNGRAKVLIHQPKLRELLGKGFTLLSQLILGLNVSDFTCGFKCFSAPAAEEIFSAMKIERWGFDPEILYLAKKRGYRIKEIPVIWKNDLQTKVRFPQDIINSLSELLTVVVNDRVRNIYSE
jgi:glycosyltransferase involved in cell wall biosynthesis